ncbi:MAG TPA: molybdenum cofactor biosynthesis protein MoaE [Spirochaetia bacterium]|nr:molybdenum cofactor biosynthesis protein MoaE [Spirochaetia bacterium]
MRAFDLFELSSQPINVDELAASLTHSSAGGFVSFEGRVRDTNDSHMVIGLEYEAYPALSLSEGTAIVREALEGVLAARCVHRTGRLAVGDVAVWVGVIAGHREEAFRACRFIIDEVKLRVPIWKKEYYRDGSSQWIGASGHGAAVASP